MPDHIFVYWATYAYVGELLRSGVRVFIYDDGFLHAKTLVVDSEVATIGSTNFDNRSFKLNFETNAFIFDERFAKTMEKSFEKDMLHGHEITLEEYNKRSILIRFKESISRLLADIL
jgi:cardiolipin synthase